MTQDIVTLYVTLLSQFFALSSSTHSPVISLTPQASTADPNAIPPLPAFVPPNSNALSISHWLLKTLTELTECVGDLGALELAGEASASLKELVASARWKFEEAVCGAWVRGEFCIPSVSASLLILLRQTPRCSIDWRRGNPILTKLRRPYTYDKSPPSNDLAR